MTMPYENRTTFFGIAVALIFVLATPVGAKDPDSLPVTPKNKTPAKDVYIHIPDVPKPTCPKDCGHDTDQPSGTPPGTSGGCGAGWISTSTGTCMPQGSTDCGNRTYCSSGTICTNTNECLESDSERTCPDRQHYCSKGSMCLADNTTCLELTSERICPDGVQYCPKEGAKCFQDYSCWRPSGPALIGGMGWIVGYNIHGLTQAQIAKIKDVVKQQFERSGQKFNEEVFKKYEFVLGIADSTTKIGDMWRIVRDQLEKGEYSAREQSLYNSLRHRAFETLDCHSNGAMICLAALENEDVRAERVMLYGPQITIESLRELSNLVQKKKLKSVDIYINHNDWIPSLAMLFSTSLSVKDLRNRPLLFDHDILVDEIHAISRNISVHQLDCNLSIDDDILKCHDEKTYEHNLQTQTPQ